MEARKLAIPLLAFAGGAVLGRVFGLKRLVRGAMTAAAVTGVAKPAMLESYVNGRAARPTRRRKPVNRVAHRRNARRKSSPV